MGNNLDRCKSCGTIFKELDDQIDKCAKKRLYCALCLAQKNPLSVTEQKIKRKYILLTAATALIIFGLLLAINWGKNKNNNIFEYIVSFGLGYLIVWGFTAILLFPVLKLMKKPHRAQINQEKERYIEEIEEKKKSRKNLQEQ